MVIIVVQILTTVWILISKRTYFFRQIDEIIDWSLIEKEIDKDYKNEQIVDDCSDFRGKVFKEFAFDLHPA